MEERRVTIKDIAEELGLSTATVSNVIHGKTKKISERTISKVQEKLETSGYIPNMAAVLLAQNSSRIVCVVLSDDKRYEGRMLEDPFVSSVLNGLSKELKQRNYFMMIQEEKDIDCIVQYASMWNMAGLILIGYCQQDYEALRSRMHIPLVVLDAYADKVHHFSDAGLANVNGGELAGRYLYEKGHRRIMYLADNKEDCDYDRYLGMRHVLEENGVCCEEKQYQLVSCYEEERQRDLQEICERYFMNEDEMEYTAVFCASDMYAIEFMNVLTDRGIKVPEKVSVMGFDDVPIARLVRPRLTTVRQDLRERAVMAVELLEELMEGKATPRAERMSLELVERDSVKDIN